MEPLSLKTRRTLSILFFIVFTIIVFFVWMYASGYRFGERFILESTGGVYVSVPSPGATLFINGETVGSSTFLDKSFFVDRLSPGRYTVEVIQEGFRPWQKELVVQREYVTDATAFLVPQEFSFLHVSASATSSATTTHLVSEDEFSMLDMLFMHATTTEAIATSTLNIRAEPIELIIRDGNLFVRWNRDVSRAPSAFCIAPQACVVEISLEIDAPETMRAEFYREGVVYQTPEGIFFTEVDVKEPRVLTTLFQGAADFRIVHNELIIRADGQLYLLEDW